MSGLYCIDPESGRDVASTLLPVARSGEVFDLGNPEGTKVVRQVYLERDTGVGVCASGMYREGAVVDSKL